MTEKLLTRDLTDLTDLTEVLVDAEPLHDAVPGDLHGPQHHDQELTSPHVCLLYLFCSSCHHLELRITLLSRIIPDPEACQELFHC